MYPDFTREFIVHADASGYGVGELLAQIQDIPLSDFDPTIIHGD
jgi:hypothetical protein